MESISPVAENPSSTRDLITESFLVSGGSAHAQALFIKGLSLHRGVSYFETYHLFKETINEFNEEDIMSIVKTMSVGHQENHKAKLESKRAFKEAKRIGTNKVLEKQIPHETLLWELYFFTRLQHYKKKNINSALLNVWQGPEDKRIPELKAISAALGLYKNFIWWKNLSNEKQSELIDQGKSILNQGKI